MALTKRQREIYDFISQFVQKNGYSPSFEEIGDGMGLSSLATVHKHLTNLEHKGMLNGNTNVAVRFMELHRGAGANKKWLLKKQGWRRRLGRTAAANPLK